MNLARLESELQPFIDIGLTVLEAEVYRFLLGQSAATGYRVAQALGRPVGNVYKAIEALESKGAVVTAEEGDSRAARAVDFAEFAAQVRCRLDAAIEQGTALAARAEMPPADDRVFTLRDRTQVLERARAMIRSARSFVLATLCPAPMEELAPDLANVLAGGICVGVKCFRRVELAGADLVLDPRGETVFDAAPGQWLQLTGDGENWLHALFSLDGGTLHEAYWTANPLLCWTAFTGLSSDFVLAAMRNELRGESAGESPEMRLARLADVEGRLRVYETPRSPAKLSLVQRYRDPSPGRRRKSP